MNTCGFFFFVHSLFTFTGRWRTKLLTDSCGCAIYKMKNKYISLASTEIIGMLKRDEWAGELLLFSMFCLIEKWLRLKFLAFLVPLVALSLWCFHPFRTCLRALFFAALFDRVQTSMAGWSKLVVTFNLIRCLLCDDWWTWITIKSSEHVKLSVKSSKGHMPGTHSSTIQLASLLMSCRLPESHSRMTSKPEASKCFKIRVSKRQQSSTNFPIVLIACFRGAL